MNDPLFVLYSPSEADANHGAGFWSAEDGWSPFDEATQYHGSLRVPLSFPKSSMNDAGWVMVGSILYLALAKEFSGKSELKYQLDQLDDRYADKVIAGQSELFDAIEIHGCRDEHIPGNQYGGNCIETVDADPQFFSVYVHYVRGGVQCVGDFVSRSAAVAYADELSRLYGWDVADYSPDAPTIQQASSACAISSTRDSQHAAALHV